MKKIPINLILYTAMFLMAGILVISVTRQTQQSAMTTPFPVHFAGEYSQDGGEWQTLGAETDLSAYAGDITFRGGFDTELPEGAEIRFYLNHIGMEICRNGESLYESSHEMIPDMCGSAWVSWELPAISPEDVLEIRLHNPHSFGNRNAYTQFLDSVYTGSDAAMKKYFDRQSLPYKVVSVFILVASVALIGTAVGYWLLRLPDNSLLLKIGIMSLMMGAYMYLDAKDFSLWGGQLTFDTYARRLAMMSAAGLMGRVWLNCCMENAGKWRKSQYMH